MDLAAELGLQLSWHWDAHVRPRLSGLTDDEYLWEPVPGCWNVRRRDETTTSLPAGVGDHVADFEFPEPVPVPFTTIAWRMAHVTNVFADRNGRHFDGPAADWMSGSYPPHAAEALTALDAAYTAWITAVTALDEAALETPVGPREPFPDAPLAGLVLHVHREAIHHLAEILLLRDLYRVMSAGSR